MIIYLLLGVQLYLLFRIGRVIGFDSGPFINFGLIIFGQIYLAQLYDYNVINTDSYFKYTLSLLCGLASFFWVIKRSNPFKRSLNINFLNDNLLNKLRPLFFVYLIIQAYHVWLTIESGGGGARVIVAKNILPLIIIHDVLQGAAYMFLAINLINRKYFYFIVVAISCLLSGSKQSVLILIFEMTFISHLCFGRRPFSLFGASLIGLAAFLASALFFYKDDIALQNLEKFIEYRGDIYHYLFNLNLRSELYDAYSWMTYFLHHSFRMVGMKAYDGPIGTMLFSLRDGLPLALTNGGPITPFYVVMDVLFHDPVIYIYLLLGLIVGYISAKIFCAGCSVFISGNIALILIGYWMMQSWYLITDPTVFSYRFTPIFWILVVPLLIIRLVNICIKK